MTEPSSAAATDLAPTGVLRAAINFGNPVLAQKDPASGEPRGVSVDLARELAARLGVEVAFVPFEAAGQVVEALKTRAWDVAFLAIDPARAAGIAFTTPYVVIEGTYLVRADSDLKKLADVDRDGVRVAVGRGAAYDLFLSRTIQNARLVRAETSSAAVELFVSDRLEAAAGVRQPLEKYAAERTGYRVLDGRFTAIEQAMGVPLDNPAGHAFVGDFIEEMKASGFVTRSLQASGQGDAQLAPAARRPAAR